MDGMKRLLLLLGCSGALLCGADLAGVRKVYVMPMAKGLDQYLANRISNRKLFQIVTDPKLADAILTDAIGQNFQAQLENISPTPEPPKPADVPAKPEKDKDKEKEKEKKAKAAAPDAGDDASSLLSMFQDTEGKSAAPISSFGRGKGTVFLVDAKSRQVVWSTFEPAKGVRNRDLDRTATEIVARLKKDLPRANGKGKEAMVEEAPAKPAPPAPVAAPAPAAQPATPPPAAPKK